MTDQMPEPTLPESAWFKSSYSSGEGGECIEVAEVHGAMHVRDSKTIGGPVMTISARVWSGFVRMVGEGLD